MSIPRHFTHAHKHISIVFVLFVMNFIYFLQTNTCICRCLPSSGGMDVEVTEQLVGVMKCRVLSLSR